MSVVYGIDFGTCYSCIAACEDDGTVGIIPSERGTNTTPSVVMFNINKDGLPVVGQVAKNNYANNPKANNVIAFAKTEMVDELTASQYQVTAGERRHLSPIEPVACIYYKIFTYANEQRRVGGFSHSHDAVITVPAVCSDIQREKTKIAAELAGINVLQVINEPTAAAISYNIKVGETVLVFDLGGGTLDVSILKRISESDYKVLSSAGNPELGGKDWDRMLLTLCYEKLDWEITEFTTQQLISIEQAKIDLCVAQSADITLVNPSDGTTGVVSLDIAEFEQASSSLVEAALKVIDSATSSAVQDEEFSQIDRVCLAGGSSKMPAIKKSIQKHLPNVSVDLNDPDQAIAKGAAKYAHAITSGDIRFDIKIDERGHAFGLVTKDENNRLVIHNIIMRRDPVLIDARSYPRYMPKTSKTLPIQIIENDSDSDMILYRGEKAFFDGEIEFPSPVSIGERVDIILSRDKDGIVHLTASCGESETKFEFATKVDSIPQEVKSHVLEMIEKMAKVS